MSLIYVEQATPKPNTPPSYNEVLKKNLNRSQTNRLKRRAADRAEKANREAEQTHAEAATANIDREDVAEKPGLKLRKLSLRLKSLNL